MAVVVEVADQRHVHAHHVQPLADARHRGGGFRRVHSDAHEFGTRAPEVGNLFRRSPRHRRYRYWSSTARRPARQHPLQYCQCRHRDRPASRRQPRDLARQTHAVLNLAAMRHFTRSGVRHHVARANFSFFRGFAANRDIARSDFAECGRPCLRAPIVVRRTGR